MNIQLTPTLAGLAAWVTFMGGIWTLFERAEIVLKDEHRIRISRWLNDDSFPSFLRAWPQHFVSVFDRVFGRKHWTWRCFGRSIVASTIALAMMALVVSATVHRPWRAFGPLTLGTFVADASGQPRVESAGEMRIRPIWFLPIIPSTVAVVLAFLFLSIAINVVPDYLSLLETRYVINAMVGRRILGIVAFLAVDLVLTSAIAGMGFFLADFMGRTFWHGGAWSPNVAVDNLQRVLSAATFWKSRGTNAILGIWFYSAFFTTIWSWLFFTGALLTRVLTSLGTVVRVMGRVLDTESKPLRSMGFMCMFLVTALYAIFAVVIAYTGGR